MKIKQDSGQVGLVVLLITVVLLTVGVSVASRSVSELKLSRQEQESTRALDISESGIEDALSKDLSTVGHVDAPGVDNYHYDVSPLHTLDATVDRGHTVELNLGQAGDMTIKWPVKSDRLNCSAGVDKDPAVEVAILVNATTVRRYAYDACGARTGAGGNGFTAAGYAGGIATAPVINFVAADKFARVKVLYNQASLSVTGTNLPVQTYKVRSYTTMSDGTTRAVEVTKPIAALPSIFDYVLFSGSTITK